MNKKMILSIIPVLLFSCFFYTTACKQPEPPQVSIEITGTLTLPAGAPGKSFIVAFDTDKNPYNGIYRSATGSCGAGTSVPYTITLNSAANFYIYAYVENDNYFGASGMQYLNTGDYFGVYGSIFPSWPASANAAVAETTGQVFNIDLVTAGLNVNGTLTLSTARSTPYYVVIDTDLNYGNGFAAIATGSCTGASSVSYNMLSVFPGPYFAYAVVDVDNDGNINYDPGDELGYYGASSPLVPPSAAGLVIPEGAGSTTANITLQVNNNNAAVILKLPASASGKPYAVWFRNTLELSVAAMASADWAGVCGTETTIFTAGNISAGSYYIIAYVDVSTTGTPNQGDYLGVYDAAYPDVPDSTVSLPGFYAIDLVQVSNNVAGDVTGVGTVTAGTATYVAALSNFSDFNSVVGYCRGTTAGDFRYNMFVPFSGTYIMVGIVDVSGTMNFSDPGNMVGFAGNTGMFPYIPVTTPNIALNHRINNEVDIPVGEIPFVP